MAKQKQKPIIPPRLLPGDTVGIVAPASPFERKTFNRGIAALHTLGYRTLLTDDLFMKNGYLAGSDLQRAELINRFFADSTVKAILCAKGGFGSMRVLPLLDYTVIRQNPKILVGFSDITALLAALYRKCNLVTFHGPVVTTLGDSDKKTKDALLVALSSNEKLEIKPPKGITVQPGSASGPVLAGNLTTLCHLLGTPYEPSFRGHILLIEDRGETLYRLDRMLTQMKLAGCFKGLAGLALGSFEGCGSQEEFHAVVRNIFHQYAIPILAGLDIGHGTSNITIPIGLEATLDASQQWMGFHKPATWSGVGPRE